MMTKTLLAGLALLAGGMAPLSCAAANELTPLEAAGKAIFFDTALSEPAGQACASCHAPQVGFTSADSERNKRAAIVAGAVPDRAGNRTPPSVAYATFAPPLHYDRKEKTWLGGQFRDGRAATLAEQASGPFVNPVEMNNPDLASVCQKVARAEYAPALNAASGANLDCSKDGMQQIIRALVAYESSSEVNPFSSKYDFYLKGQAQLSDAEKRGLTLFQNKAKCDTCHVSKPGPDGAPPLFTDFGYDNLGVPRNPDNPFYQQSPSINPKGSAYVDPGLAGVVKKAALRGAFKSPTLRNVAAGTPEITRAYMHNGVFKSLGEVVDFYSDRDTIPGKWTPEEKKNINHKDMGALHLTAAEKADLIAFLRTLTDGWTAATP